MKYIFLDIDGVLNSETDFMSSAYEYDPVHSVLQKGERWKVISAGKLALLNRIVKETDAKIIFSSTWRTKCDAKKMTKIFRKYGKVWEFDESIWIGVTPNWTRRSSGSCQQFRSREIKQYLHEHPEVENYVILDDNREVLIDSYFDIDIPEERFIHTDEFSGLTKLEMFRAINILGRNDKYQKKHDKEMYWLRCMI